MAKTHFDLNDEQLAKAEKIHTTCASLTDPDKCEMAFKRIICIHQTAEKMDFHFGNL